MLKGGPKEGFGDVDKNEVLDLVDDVKKEEDHEYISKLITQYFSQKLFVEVSDFQMKKSREDIYAEEVIDSEAEEDEDDIYDDMLEEYSEDYDSDDGGKRKKKGTKEQK